MYRLAASLRHSISGINLCSNRWWIKEFLRNGMFSWFKGSFRISQLCWNKAFNWSISSFQEGPPIGVVQGAITEVIYWLSSLVSSTFYLWNPFARMLNNLLLIYRCWYWWEHSEFRGAWVYLFLQLNRKSHFPCADTWIIADFVGVKWAQRKNKTCWRRVNQSSSIQETFHRCHWALWKMFLNQSNGWR